MSRAVVNNSLLYADDSIVFYHKCKTEIEKQLIRDFSSVCDWFVDNKLSIHFGQDKRKPILFGTKHKLWNAKSLNIVYNAIEIKPHAKVKHVGCILDESLSGESMALNVIDGMNSRLKFLHRQNCFLNSLDIDFYVMHWYKLFWLCLHSLVSKSFKETKIKTSSNAK